EVLDKVVADSPAYRELTEAFDEFEGSIKSQTSTDGQSLESLEREVTSEISSWEASFSLAVESIQPAEILKTLVKPQLIDETHGGEIDQAGFGAGFQRHLIFSLIKLAAKHANPPKAASGGKKEFAPHLTWILFEEPEAFLHPSQEELLHDSLLKLVQDGSTQVLLTTHSSRFVSRSMDDLTRLIRLRRDSGISTSYQLSKTDLNKLFKEALVADDSIRPVGTTEAGVDQAAMMASLKTELWLQPSRTTAFFSRRVILVEGQSETALYTYLLTRELLEPPVRGLSVIDCLGKWNIHRFVSILGAFGIDHSVLYDGDGGRSHDAEVTAAITRAKSSFTKRITRLPNNLESELGIDPLPRNESSRKPQYILYHLETEQVDESKLSSVKEEFIRLATDESGVDA
ncbi:MAG: AAA family ATPase, partial [Nitrososphaerota archaeon]|nr:AAA family ATPase [Nitrososphaerota archaeon]